MDRENYLRARGWVQHGAGLDLWQAPTGGEWRDSRDAVLDQRQRDREHTFAHGSVRYHPTAEQAQTSPLLAACAARGMCEREVIGLLFEQSRAYVGQSLRLLSTLGINAETDAADEPGQVPT